MTLDLPSTAVLWGGAGVCTLAALLTLVASLIARARRLERGRREQQLNSVYNARTRRERGE